FATPVHVFPYTTLFRSHLRGSFSERLIAIKVEVRLAEGQVIVFLDELHVWMNAGQGGDGADASGELKTALERGQFPCVGATTEEDRKSTRLNSSHVKIS